MQDARPRRGNTPIRRSDCADDIQQLRGAMAYRARHPEWQQSVIHIQLGRCDEHVAVPYTANQWVHLVWVHTGGDLYAYKNGVLVGSIASGTTFHNASIRIGAACSGGCGSNLKFTGSIDDVRFYNRALTASEVKQLYLMGK